MNPGNVLYIDVSKHTYHSEPIPLDTKRKFLGGNGFAVKYLYDNVKPGIDPLGPDNALVFAVGPATGTVVLGASIVAAATKSPLTGGFIDSYMAGLWGTEIRETGYDVVVITGSAAEPIYLLIEDEKVSFKFAGDLWGKTTFETESCIKKQLQDSRVQIAAIGPAGENLVKFATINHSTRAFGRGGLGAVLGSKNVKAIAVRGCKGVYHPGTKEILEYTLQEQKEMLAHPAIGKSIPTFGSTASVAGNNSLGILGTYNWQYENYADAEKINGNEMVKRGLKVGQKACANCIAQSAIIWQAQEEPYKGVKSRGPEYETLYSYGSLLGNNNVDSIIYADKISDELGVDTMSAGVVIAFLMECVEKGIVDKKSLDGIDVKFGNSEAMVELIKKIAYRDGIGNLLAEGVREMSSQIGQGSEHFAIHVKGLELSGHTARGLKGMALGYATSPRGGSHQDFRPGPERSGKYDRSTIDGKAMLVKKNQDMTAIGDSIIVCRRHSEGYHGAFLNDKYIKLVNLVTGFDYDLAKLTEVAERIFTLERMFNVREGLTRVHDTLPPRFLTEGIPDGPSKGMYVTQEELDQMLNEYYEIRGWDIQTGIPTDETIKRLGIDGD